MPLPNPLRDPDALPRDEAEQLAAFIDARAALPDQAAAHTLLMEAFAPQPGERLADVGCGSGVIARRLADAVGPRGTVLGLDISQVMLDFARRRDVPAWLTFQRMTADRLPAGDFDGITAARTLMHAADPGRLLHAIRGALKASGRIALLENDWGTLVVDHSNQPLTQRIIEWRAENVDGDNRMGRKLAAACVDAGLRVTDVRVHVAVALASGNSIAGSVRRCGDLALAHGVITAADYAAWTGELDDRLTTGRYFASLNDYVVVAAR